MCKNRSLHCPHSYRVSLSPYIKTCISVIEEHKLEYELGQNGTAIEVKWDKVFEYLKNCNEVLHEKGVQRIYTTLKVNTRTDKKHFLKDKVQSVSDNSKSFKKA